MRDRVGAPEDERARHDPVRPRLGQGPDGVGADAPVDDDDGPEAGPETPRPGSHEGRDPVRCARVEADALNADDGAHHQHPVYGIEQTLSLAHRLVDLEAERWARPPGADLAEGGPYVRAGPALYGHHVGSGVDETAEPIVGVGHVEMDVERLVRTTAQSGHDVRAKKQFGGVVAVKHVDVEGVRDLSHTVDRLT